MISVLLTAAVRPTASGPLRDIDPGRRLLQYQCSLERWAVLCRRHGWGLSIVETSGHRATELLDRVPEPHRSSINIVVVTPPPRALNRGKGAAEFHAIREFLDQTPMRDDDTLYKVTGRLGLRNAERVLKDLRPSEVAVRMTLARTFADSRLIGGGLVAWRQLLERLQTEVDDQAAVYAEHALAAVIAYDAALNRVRVRRFPEAPQFVGRSGTSGVEYGSAVRRARAKVLHPIEAALERVALRKQI